MNDIIKDSNKVTKKIKLATAECSFILRELNMALNIEELMK
jgi:hypothetical protein